MSGGPSGISRTTCAAGGAVRGAGLLVPWPDVVVADVVVADGVVRRVAAFCTVPATLPAPVPLLLLLATLPPTLVRSWVDLVITALRTLARTADRIKHLFDRVACRCGDCRTTRVDIAQTFDRTKVRRTGREEHAMTWTTRPLIQPTDALSSGTQPGHGTRITRRGRAALVLVLVGLLLGAFSLGRVGTQAATPRPAGPLLEQTTVHSGESLWSVAHRVAPSADPRDVVVQLRRLNHLDGSSVQVGQQLVLPRAA